MGLGVDIRFLAGVVEVSVQGEIDVATAPALGSLLGSLVDQGHVVLMLDFSELEFLDASGLGLIAAISARLNPGGSITIRSLPSFTRYIMDITGVGGLVHMDPSDPNGVVAGLRSGSGGPSALAPSEREELAGVLNREATNPEIDLAESGLRLVVALAKATVRGADGVGVSLHRVGSMVTVASTDEMVDRMDHHQYAVEQGPCVAAMTDGQPFHVASSAEETRWPAFVPVALAAGISSVYSTPLHLAARPVGALKLYSRDPEAFGPRQQAQATSFARSVMDILTFASSCPTAGQLRDRLYEALESREVIAQSQGVLMERHGSSADGAYATLRRWARRAEHPVRQQAAEVVTSTAHRDPSAPAGVTNG